MNLFRQRISPIRLYPCACTASGVSATSIAAPTNYSGKQPFHSIKHFLKQYTMYRTLLRITVLLLIAAKSYSQCPTVNNLLLDHTAVFGYPSATNGQKVFDNDLSTGWSSGAAGSFKSIGVDLGTAHHFCHATLTFDAVDYPTAFEISGSNAWTNGFTTMKYVGDNTHGGQVDVDLNDIGEATVIQIIFYAGPTSNYTVYDFKAYQVDNNTPPSIQITNPTTTGTYYANQNISLEVTASDVGGSVTRVDYYDGANTTPIASSTTAPFTASWNNVPAGAHTIRAIATDNLNVASTAATVQITVLQQPAYMKNWSLTGSNLNNTNTGTVFIGSPPATTVSDAKLLVNGNIYALKLTVKASWADYVFNSGYNLRPLSEVENYISKHKHLPDVPSAKQIEEKGVSVGENQAVLLKKIEELTLYLIRQNKQLQKQQR